MSLRIALYLLLVLAAFCVAGAIDLAEEERLSLAGYVNEHLVISNKECQ
jgi:hypothetical protein